MTVYDINGNQAVTVDQTLDSSSTNPVGNAPVTQALAGKADANSVPTSVVRYIAQSLTAAQKTQARSNIGAAAQGDLAGYIPLPSRASAGDFLVYNGSAWGAVTVSTWQGGSY